MSSFELPPTRGGSLLPLWLVGAGVALLSVATLEGRGVAAAAGMLAIVSVFAATHRFVLRWEILTSIVIVVILTIPIKRYGFAASLPFDLEPYRIAIAVVVALWISALLVDPGVRVSRSALDGPLLLFALAVIGSVALNPDSITQYNRVKSFAGDDFSTFLIDGGAIPYMDVSGNVAKQLLFLMSFYLAFYFIVSVIRGPDAIHAVLKTLVGGAAAVASFAIVERRTGYNVFDHLAAWIPLLNFEGAEEGVSRGGGRLRVYASAQHPIALAALFAIVTPVSIYLSYLTRRRLWYAASAALMLGALATVSRTSITMLAAVLVVFLILRPVVLKPLLVWMLPALIVIHLVVPGAIGGIRQAFFPAEGLVADQTEFGGRLSSRRLDPQFDVIEAQPAFGQGYATRITAGPDANARILDNQWLATGVETGLVGVLAFVWLFVRFLRRAGAAAKVDPSPRGWLLTALSGSALAFAVGMLTYDAFSFIQAMFVFFVLLALGASTLAYDGPWPGQARVGRRPNREASAR